MMPISSSNGTKTQTKILDGIDRLARQIISRKILTDLDLAIREDLESHPGAPSKTGTRAFMAIGALMGEKTLLHA